VLSLPSFVLGLVFRFLSCVVPFRWCIRCDGVSACAFAGVFPWPSCAFLWVVGSLCVCPLFGCCRLPSCRLLLPFPLRYCWRCGCALSSSLHFVSWQHRPLALCGVCFTLYTMMHVLSGSHAEVFICDDPGPPLTLLSYTFAILGSKCGILRPCPLLPSRCPLSRSCYGCVLFFFSRSFWLKFSVQVTSSRAHLLQRRVLVTA